MLDLLYITLIIVFCVDLSGAIQKLSAVIGHKIYPTIPYTDGRIPLIGCSLCSTGWAGILYLLITGTLCWRMVAYVALLAFLTPVFSTLYILLKDAITGFLRFLHKLFIN